VAGCGTNQALLTALRFPRAHVVGTDLSTASLDICQKNAAEVGVTNLELRRESINEATYEGAFDFILCTGVIHHTYDPAAALARLAGALKRDGVMEILVYNRFHRTITSAFQKAIRILTRDLGADDLAVAKRLAAGLSVDNRLAQFVGRHRDWEESDFADLLINPVEHSFTVDSLAAMADRCGLELVRPCISLYAKFRAETLDWEMHFEDPELQRVHDALPDVDRWRVSNLLLHEKSPMLWFYLRRKDATWPRKTERELAEEFLRTRFVRTGTQQQVFLRDRDGVFRPSQRPVPYPAAAPDPSVRSIYQRFESPRRVGEVFAELGIAPSFAAAHEARQKLTIPAFPYLKAVR
jgi:SAM-dependent methyltransferase